MLGTITVRVQATDAETAAGSLDVDVRIDSGTWQTATYNTFTQRYERALNTTTLTDGSHTVTARATDGFGNTTTTAPRSFTVNNNQAPTANAGGPYTGSTGSSVSFSSVGSNDPDGTIASYLWNFGDGDTSTQANPTHIYATGGTKIVTLTVTDNDGAPSLPDTAIAVINVTPVAEAGGPYTGTAGVTVNFDGSGSSDGDGSIETYSWNWGDGTSTPASTFAPAIHTYATGGTYTVTLTVTDDDGTTDTDTTTATIAANAAPTVSITSPTASDLITGPLTVRIDATDPESIVGTLDVEYRVDSGLWKTATYNTFTQRYEDTVDTSILTDAPHTVSARATDGFGNTTTSLSVSFTVDNNEPPTVSITSPTSNASVTGSTTITATAIDDAAVSRVEFFVDGVSIGTDTSSAGGWNITWDTTTATSGRHTLSATATDVPGKTGTSAGVSVTVDQPPTVDITTPRSLQVIDERVTIAATTTDDVAVDQVEFFVDGVSIGTDSSAAGGWSVSWNTRSTNNGRRTVRAVATDSAGHTALDSIVVTVDNDLAPSITITGPRDGATIFAVGIVLISAIATDEEGVEQVEFFIDGASIGVDTIGSNGWSAIWNATRATIGPHTIRAVATDTIEQTATDSNGVNIQAFTTPTTEPPTPTTTQPPVEVDTPALGLSATAFSLAPPTIAAGGEIALTVSLAATVPGKADVQFLLDGQPLGDAASVNAGSAANGTGTEAVFTRTLPNGMQVGLHRVEVVTTEQPPTVLASRTIGVVAGDSTAPEEPTATEDPEDSPTSPGLIVAIVVGSIAALTAVGFGAAGWYRRKMIVRRLSGR